MYMVRTGQLTDWCVFEECSSKWLLNHRINIKLIFDAFIYKHLCQSINPHPHFTWISVQWSLDCLFFFFFFICWVGVTTNWSVILKEHFCCIPIYYWVINLFNHWSNILVKWSDTTLRWGWNKNWTEMSCCLCRLKQSALRCFALSVHAQ